MYNSVKYCRIGYFLTYVLKKAFVSENSTDYYSDNRIWQRH